MIKRDWKLPNPSYFTYTSIVQPVLQVYNPFLQADSPFSPLKVANSKREKQLQNDIKGVDLSPNALIGYPNGLKALIPHFTSQYPILQVNTPFYTVFQSLFCSKWSKFEREK